MGMIQPTVVDDLPGNKAWQTWTPVVESVRKLSRGKWVYIAQAEPGAVPHWASAMAQVLRTHFDDCEFVTRLGGVYARTK